MKQKLFCPHCGRCLGECSSSDETGDCGLSHGISDSTGIGGGHRALGTKTKTSGNKQSSQRSKELHKSGGKR